MLKSAWRVSLVCLLIGASVPAGSAVSWQLMEPLPGTLRVNGVGLQATHVVGARDPQMQLEQLRAEWIVDGHSLPGAISRRGEWWLLDRMVDHWHESWQLRSLASGGSEGYASRVDLRVAPQRAPPMPLRLPTGATRQSVTESSDADRHYIQWLVALGRPSSGSARLELLAAAASAGWALSAAPTPQLLQWQRPGESLQCVFVARGSQRWLLLSVLRSL